MISLINYPPVNLYVGGERLVEGNSEAGSGGGRWGGGLGVVW